MITNVGLNMTTNVGLHMITHVSLEFRNILFFWNTPELLECFSPEILGTPGFFECPAFLKFLGTISTGHVVRGKYGPISLRKSGTDFLGKRGTDFLRKCDPIFLGK